MVINFDGKKTHDREAIYGVLEAWTRAVRQLSIDGEPVTEEEFSRLVDEEARKTDD